MVTKTKPVSLDGLLRRMDAAALTALLTQRPDATVAPEPRTFAELAQRLSAHHSVLLALHRLPTPAVQLAEVMQALGDGCPRAAVEQLLGLDEHDDRLDGPLDALRRLALVWPDGATLRMVPALGHLTAAPLALGAPAAELLAPLTVEQLTRIGGEYGLRGPRRKADWVAALVEVLSDGATVRRVLASAPPQVADAVELLAWQSPTVYGPVEAALHRFGGYGLRPDSELSWLVPRGFLLPAGWGVGQMPREVALAIRGPDYHPELHLDAPELSTTALAGEPSPAAAAALLDGTQRLLAALSTAPAQTLTTGGIGVRELRRMTKELSVTEGEIRLEVELAAAAGLARTSDGALLPTRAGDRWLGATAGARLAALLTAWTELGPVPSHRVNGEGKALPALDLGGASAVGPPLRANLLAVLAEQPAGVTISGLDPLIDLVAWRHPLRYPDADTLGPHLVATWTEAGRLGLVADGALTGLGRAVAAGATEAELADLAEPLLPRPVEQATFLPDLTAVVSGPPSTALAELLDGVADQESRDVASTWRLSPSSVRRALDGGQNAEQLLARLTEVADRPLPQPVTYLITDAARRHGQLRVVDVACCVCTDDPALAAEIAVHRGAAKLGLRQLAPTVLAGAEPPATTLRLLRAAGYSPVQQSSTGQVVVERAAARRAPDPPRSRRPPAPAGADPATLAARLLGVAHSSAVRVADAGIG